MTTENYEKDIKDILLSMEHFQRIWVWVSTHTTIEKTIIRGEKNKAGIDKMNSKRIFKDQRIALF